MTPEEINLNNAEIAEFMEATYKKEYSIVNFLDRPTINIQSNSFCVDELEYHKSWDWIMPVVKKIDSLMDNTIDRYLSEYVELSEELDNTVTLYEIELVHCQVVNFIKWYNEKKSANE